MNVMVKGSFDGKLLAIISDQCMVIDRLEILQILDSSIDAR